MRISKWILVTALAAAPLAANAPVSRAGSVGSELWLAGGFVDADYSDYVKACIRGGAGATFFDRVGLGGSAQVDQIRYFYFGYAAVYFPQVGMLEPYGRFHVGRRDDIDETALGWTVGAGVGDGSVRVFIEAHGVYQPGYAYGASFGFSF